MDQNGPKMDLKMDRKWTKNEPKMNFVIFKLHLWVSQPCSLLLVLKKSFIVQIVHFVHCNFPLQNVPFWVHLPPLITLFSNWLVKYGKLRCHLWKENRFCILLKGKKSPQSDISEMSQPPLRILIFSIATRNTVGQSQLNFLILLKHFLWKAPCLLSRNNL